SAKHNSTHRDLPAHPAIRSLSAAAAPRSPLATRRPAQRAYPRHRSTQGYHAAQQVGSIRKPVAGQIPSSVAQASHDRRPRSGTHTTNFGFQESSRAGGGLSPTDSAAEEWPQSAAEQSSNQAGTHCSATNQPRMLLKR